MVGIKSSWKIWWIISYFYFSTAFRFFSRNFEKQKKTWRVKILHFEIWQNPFERAKLEIFTRTINRLFEFISQLKKKHWNGLHCLKEFVFNIIVLVSLAKQISENTIFPSFPLDIKKPFQIQLTRFVLLEKKNLNTTFRFSFRFFNLSTITF